MEIKIQDIEKVTAEEILDHAEKKAKSYQPEDHWSMECGILKARVEQLVVLRDQLMEQIKNGKL